MQLANRDSHILRYPSKYRRVVLSSLDPVQPVPVERWLRRPAAPVSRHVICINLKTTCRI